MNTEIDNLGGQEPQGSDPIQDSYSMFNEPIGVDDFDDDSIDVQDDFWGAGADEDPIPPSNESTEVELDLDDQGTQGETEDDLNFDDKVIEEEVAKEEVKSDEELMAELKKRGFNVTKGEETNALSEKASEVTKLSTVVSDAQNFMQLPAENIVREKIISNLQRSYRESGKQGLINSEDFNLEVEEEYDQYADNPALLKIFANNIKTEVQNVIQNTEGKISKLNSEIENENKSTLIKKRSELQNGIKAIHKSGVLGVKPTPEESKEIYNSIINGDFTKQVNSDPNLVAEFATYLKFREKISTKLGGASYGEGVKAAVESINGGPLKTQTSLASAVKSSAQGVARSGGIDRRKVWGQESFEIQPTDDGNQRVAGTGSFL